MRWSHKKKTKRPNRNPGTLPIILFAMPENATIELKVEEETVAICVSVAVDFALLADSVGVVAVVAEAGGKVSVADEIFSVKDSKVSVGFGALVSSVEVSKQVVV